VSNCTPASAGNENASGDRGKWTLALDHLTEALKLLDESDAPGDIAPHLDLAMHNLRSAIARDAQSRS
jgi:hypothetical protein